MTCTCHISYCSTLYLVLAVVLCGCSGHSALPEGAQRQWTVKLPDLGSSSSPRARDLNADGILDIVFGAGKAEFMYCDTAIVAMNGANGKVLWTAASRDQIFGSPNFMDITGDGVDDVFIGGRSARFLAIDGLSGKTIWEFFPQGDTVDSFLHQLYNFYQPQFIRDVTSDGVKDIIVSNGGYIKAAPGDSDRPPGKLMIIDAATGRLIVEAYMPDGRETYMSVVLSDFGSDTEYVIFGTGGETVEGSLYKIPLEEVFAGTLEEAVLLVSGQQKGFIAPPVLVDISQDGVEDIVVNAVDGRIIAIDGQNNDILWETTMENTEAYCSLAVGYFTPDSIPDFFTNFGIGTFPDLMRSYQLMIDGSNGNIERKDSLGSFHYASPVVYDFTGDGRDDVLYPINYNQYGTVANQLKVFDFHNDTILNVHPRFFIGANIGPSPWLGDLDNDKLLDIIYIHENNPVDFFSLEKKEGIVVHKMTTGIELTSPVRWGSYMGTSFDGLYLKK